MSRKIRKMKTLAGALLLGVSSFALLHSYAEGKADGFNETKVVVDNKKMSLEAFYCRLSYSNGSWQYISNDGKAINVDSLCDGAYRSGAISSMYRSLEVSEKVDTVIVVRDKKQGNSAAFLINGMKKLDQPSRGTVFLYRPTYKKLVKIREFVSDDPELQSIYEKDNDKYSCSRVHEYHHVYNMQIGIRDFNSYEIKFVEACFDEMSSYLAQCLEQCRQYEKYDKNEIYLQSVFDFLERSVDERKIRTQGRLNKEEQKFLANRIFDWFMRVKYDCLEERNDDRTRAIMAEAEYSFIRPDWKKHEKVMRACFKIDGYDFWPYIKEREKEIFDKISAEKRAEYKRLTSEKFNNMTYFEKLEELKNIKREHYQQRIMKDYATAQLIRFMRLNKR